MITGDQEFGSLSAILCGNAIPMISDEFRTGAVLKTRTELTPEQKKEFDALPGEIENLNFKKKKSFQIFSACLF